MNLAFGQLPSLWTTSAKISEALGAPKLVIVSFPNGSLAKSWHAILVNTLYDYLQVQESLDEPVEVTIQPEDADPLDKLASALGETLSHLDDFFYVSQGDPLVILKWPEGAEISSAWASFIHRATSEIKQSDQSRYFRKILVFNEGNQKLPDYLIQTPAIDHFRFWNALTWEELRLFANSRLADEKNEIRKAWMVSTYCGASNFDLKVLTRLTEDRPKFLDDIKHEVLSVISSEGDGDSPAVMMPDKSFGRGWHPPTSLEDAWNKGSIIGASIERGITRPWYSVSDCAREKMVQRQIWKEQVSGLFPLLIELGHELNESILATHREELSQFVGSWMEPAEMLKAIRDANIWLPKNLHAALLKLKGMRNQLAHLEPIERTDLETAWDLQIRIRAGQM